MSNTLEVSIIRKPFIAVGNAYSCLYQATVGGFLDNLYTNLYERYIKTIFLKNYQEEIRDFTYNPEHYYKYLTGSEIPLKYESYVSNKLISMEMALIILALAIYLLIAHLDIFVDFKKSFKSKASDALAFYLLFILPFKNSYFILSIRNVFNSILSLFGIHNFIPVDEVAYVMIVLIFYLFLRIVKFEYKKNVSKSKEMAKSIKKYGSLLKAAALFFAFFLYCLNVIFLLGNAYILTLSLMGASLATFGVFFSIKKLNENALLSILRKILKIIGSHIFSFAKLAMSLCHVLFLIVIMLRGSFMDSFLYNAIFCYFDAFFYYLFSPKADLCCILFKALILILLLLYCTIKEMLASLDKDYNKTEKNARKNMKILTLSFNIEDKNFSWQK